MRLPSAIVAAGASLLVPVLAASSVDTMILRSDDVLARPWATLTTPDFPHLLQRQANGGDNSSPAGDAATTANQTAVDFRNSDGTLNVTAWNAVTNDACMEALRPLKQSSNPSGLSICYNLLSLEANTGAFEADMRLFKISTPRGEFADVNPEDIDVSLSYAKADISRQTTPEQLSGAGMTGATADGELRKRQSQTQEPELIDIVMFVGKIKEAEMSTNMSMAELEGLLMPALTLQAVGRDGQNVTTQVTPNEAAFLTGVFASMTIMSDFSAAQAAVDRQTERLKKGDIAFILPGTSIMVLPIGPIVVGAWFLAGLGIYGFGTFERMRYAQLYHERKALRANTRTL